MTLIKGANLATEDPEYGFPDRGFEHARAFQNRVAEWVHEGEKQVAVLRAPTGAGKTATFYELIDANEITLLVYPTNALLNQQAERFEDNGVPTKVLTGETLEGHHRQRTENLLKAVNRFATNHDVVITNPDILQAIIQDQYEGDQAMEFFDKFDAIVYDEFHFYGDLAASGLLLQTRIIIDRNPNAQILLASATPNESFVDFVTSVFDLSVRGISSEYDPEGDQFRHDVRMNRRDADRIMEDRESVAERLHDAIEGVDRGDTRAVVVFNSVKDSNDFHSYLEAKHPDLFERAEKDNGFDTNDPDFNIDESEFSILNTTSKGEVGLDYDIRTLIMDSPRGPTAGSDFLQRFGRAGRQAEAMVDVYGLGQVTWNDKMSFEEFARSVSESLGNSQMEIGALTDLVGLRAAYALHVRDRYYNPELREDFTSVDQYGKWRGFIERIGDVLENDVGGLGDPIQENDPETKLLKFTRHCFDAFRGLRGRSLTGEIKYPRGDRTALTSYDLLTTLRHYDIAGVENDSVIILEEVRDEYPMQVTARLPGYESRPRDYGLSVRDIEQKLQQWVHDEIDRSNVEEKVDVSADLLHLFFKRIRITESVVPVLVRCGEFEIQVEMDGIPSVSAYRREI